jgi:hypothetical protein
MARAPPLAARSSYMRRGERQPIASHGEILHEKLAPFRLSATFLAPAAAEACSLEQEARVLFWKVRNEVATRMMKSRSFCKGESTISAHAWTIEMQTHSPFGVPRPPLRRGQQSLWSQGARCKQERTGLLCTEVSGFLTAVKAPSIKNVNKSLKSKTRAECFSKRKQILSPTGCLTSGVSYKALKPVQGLRLSSHQGLSSVILQNQQH